MTTAGSAPRCARASAATWRVWQSSREVWVEKTAKTPAGVATSARTATRGSIRLAQWGRS